jgi:hypothetical protein
LCLTVSVAAVTYGLMYFRHFRRIVEQPDITPADRKRPAARLGSLVVRKVLTHPLDRAILLFTARTLARSRQHRFLLAVYGGFGLAIALAFAKDLIYGRAHSHWHNPTLQGLTVGAVLLIFAVAGARAVFVLPVALRANWVFCVTSVHTPSAFFAAVRQSLLVLTAVPLWTVLAAAYLSIWPVLPAAEHLAILAVSGAFLVDLLLHRFCKIPFACSYLPGGANLKVKLGIYMIVVITVLSIGTSIELWAMQRFSRFAVFLTVLLGLSLWAWRRRVAFATSPENEIRFEELPPAQVMTLDLHDAVPVVPRA